MKHPHRYTKKQKEKIIELSLKNYSDTEIHQMTGYGRSTIGKITTEYWNKKMSEKK